MEVDNSCRQVFEFRIVRMYGDWGDYDRLGQAPRYLVFEQEVIKKGTEPEGGGGGG